MTEPSPTPDPRAEGELTGPPRWVKVLGAIALALVLLFVVLKLAGGPGEHGPGRHGPGRHGLTTSRASFAT